MGMAHTPVVCNRCNKDIEGETYPNENWCRECEPMQLKALRAELLLLEDLIEDALSDEFFDRDSFVSALAGRSRPVTSRPDEAQCPHQNKNIDVVRDLIRCADCGQEV